MTTARAQQIFLEDTPYYHCYTRCVRRAFLFGDDQFSGKNYDHRKQLIVDKIKQLSEVFAIDVCAYAIMSNHYHIVLRVDTERAESWSDKDVINRWSQLFKNKTMIDRYNEKETLSKPEVDTITDITKIWRSRLFDISWFMRCLNEWIARQANKEDECSGRFWEGRYKCQALLDEAALLTCMIYVDLNPIRANVSQTLEKSDFTSIQERIRDYNSTLRTTKNSNKKNKNKSLVAMIPQRKTKSEQPSINFSAEDYIALARWTSNALTQKKHHFTDNIKQTLQNLEINEKHWISQAQYFEKQYGRMIGPAERVSHISEKLGLWWVKGISNCRCLYIHA